MRKIEIPHNFLQTIDKCYFCKQDNTQCKLRVYFKYSNSIREVNAFAKVSKFQDVDERLSEAFLMCDNCRVSWKHTPEAKQAFNTYKKIYQQNVYSQPEHKEKRKEYNRQNWIKRKEKNNE